MSLWFPLMDCNKKLKMERLSPIPPYKQNQPLPVFHRTPKLLATPKTSHRTRKDAYSIETTSSPEVDSPPVTAAWSSLQKHRRTRNPIRGKTARKPSTTPLSGLTRKSVSLPPKDIPDFQSDPSSSPAPAEMEFQPLASLEVIPEEVVQIDDYSPQKPSPSLNHANIPSCTFFPSKPSMTPSNTTPLAGIIAKKPSRLNRSLNDSLPVLPEADDPTEEPEEAVEAQPANPEATGQVRIESFESPSKPQSEAPHKEVTSKSLPNLDDSWLNLNESLSLANDSRCTKDVRERKKRKRALNFNFLTFVVPPTIEEVEDRQLSPDLLSPTREESVVKTSEIPEIECLSLDMPDNDSEVDSVIENTPKQSRDKRDSLAGFTLSTCLQIESYSPPSSKVHGSVHFDLPEIKEIEENVLDEKSGKCNLEFVVKSHDSSDENSDEGRSNDDDIYPKIDGRNSPLAELNYSKKPIQAFESPSKAVQPFSEAIDIGAFGSPDSNASCEEPDEEMDGKSEEGVEPSTAQEEFVDESEQLRPMKRRKKGSLLERVRSVMAKVDASNALFDYEMKCGLRPSKGKFVSTPLVVFEKSGDAPSSYLVCKPLKFCKESPADDISSFVIVHASKLPSDVSEGSIILVNFPVNIMHSSNLLFPYVLAGHQIALHPTEPKIDPSTIQEPNYLFPSLESNCYVRSPTTSYKNFSSAVTRRLGEAALCQNLLDENILFLTVLHVTKLHLDSELRKTSALCCDEDSQCCWLEFSSEEDVKRASALESVNVLVDGAKVQTTGFYVVERLRLDKKTKNLVAYCFDSPFDDDVIFIVRPKIQDWVVSSSGSPCESKKRPSSVEAIAAGKSRGSRYLVEVHRVEKGPPTVVRDSEGHALPYVQGGSADVNLDQPVPFFLDGVYFYEDKLYSDEYTRLIPS